MTHMAASVWLSAPAFCSFTNTATITTARLTLHRSKYWFLKGVKSNLKKHKASNIV